MPHGRACPRARDVLLEQPQRRRVGVERAADDVPADRRLAERGEAEHAVGLGEGLAGVLVVRRALVAGRSRARGGLGADVLVRGPALRAVVLGEPGRVGAVVREVVAVLVRDELSRRRRAELVLRRGVDRLASPGRNRRAPASRRRPATGRRRAGSGRGSASRARARGRACRDTSAQLCGQRRVDRVGVRDLDVHGGAERVAGRIGAAPAERRGGEHERDEGDDQHVLHGAQSARPLRQGRMNRRLR